MQWRFWIGPKIGSFTQRFQSFTQSLEDSTSWINSIPYGSLIGKFGCFGIFCQPFTKQDSKGLQWKNSTPLRCQDWSNEIHSVFEWEGQINFEKETVLILKTIESKFEKLEKLITENHSYETPCILKLDISKGNKKFLNWLESTIV